MIFSMGTVTGRMGCIPILPVNVTFVTESLGVNGPLSKVGSRVNHGAANRANRPAWAKLS